MAKTPSLNASRRPVSRSSDVLGGAIRFRNMALVLSREGCISSYGTGLSDTPTEWAGRNQSMIQIDGTRLNATLQELAHRRRHAKWRRDPALAFR